MKMFGEGGEKKCVNINVIGFIFEEMPEYCEISEVKWRKYQKDKNEKYLLYLKL